MRATVLFLIIFLSLSCVEAADNRWKYYAMSENSDTQFSYDTESLQYLSRYAVKVLEKAVYMTPQKKHEIENKRTVDFSIYMLEIDCIHKKNNTILIAHFELDGTLVSFYDSDSPKWSNIDYESNREILYESLCPGKSS